jgi:Skp family chaperone for outer membrane proteins
MATVLMMITFFFMTAAAETSPTAEEASPVGSADTDTLGEGFEETSPVGSADTDTLGEGSGEDYEDEESELQGVIDELRGAVDEAKDAIENAAGSFEDGTEWWRTADGWIAWLQDEGAAVIVAVLSILGTIYIGISPVLNKVVKSGEKFEGATETAGAVSAQTKEMKRQYEEQMAEMREQNNAMLEQYKQGMAAAQAEARAAQERCDATLSMMREQYAGVRDDVQRLQRREGDLARMIMIGFGENEELVRRGSAAKIAEIGGAMENEQGTKA